MLHTFLHYWAQHIHPVNEGPEGRVYFSFIQFLLPLLSGLAKGGAASGKFLASHPEVTGFLAQLSGGLIGGKGQPKTLDPGKMQELFGAQALGPEFTQTLNTLMNTPGVQAAMTQASDMGAQFSNDINAKAAGASQDTSSGMKNFAESAGNQAAGGFQRQIKGQVSNEALQIAQQNLRDRAAAWANSQGIAQQTPSFNAQLGGNLLNAGSQLMVKGNSASPTGSTVDTTPPPPQAPKALIAAPTQQTLQPTPFGPTRAVKTNTYRVPMAR